MSYTPNTWAAGDTITAAKLNRIEQGIVGAESSSSSSGGWDAVIRLTHANNSGNDSDSNLTPSIVSGTFAELDSIAQSGRPPRVLVEYMHPWGSMSAMPVGWINYGSGSTMNLTIAGFFDGYNNTSQFKIIGILTWGANDTLTWKDMLS